MQKFEHRQTEVDFNVTWRRHNELSILKVSKWNEKVKEKRLDFFWKRMKNNWLVDVDTSSDLLYRLCYPKRLTHSIIQLEFNCSNIIGGKQKVWTQTFNESVMRDKKIHEEMIKYHLQLWCFVTATDCPVVTVIPLLFPWKRQERERERERQETGCQVSHSEISSSSSPLSPEIQSESLPSFVDMLRWSLFTTRCWWWWRYNKIFEWRETLTRCLGCVTRTATGLNCTSSLFYPFSEWSTGKHLPTFLVSHTSLILSSFEKEDEHLQRILVSRRKLVSGKTLW